MRGISACFYRGMAEEKEKARPAVCGWYTSRPYEDRRTRVEKLKCFIVLFFRWEGGGGEEGTGNAVVCLEFFSSNIRKGGDVEVRDVTVTQGKYLTSNRRAYH